MPTTMICRFRDFHGSPTIAIHDKLISEKGYVWWGWWNKPDELIHRNVFAHFKEIITENEFIEIFLVDSGNKTLHAATIEKIVESETETTIGSPEESQTPEYYRSNKYKAWFKITKFRDLPTEQIKEFAYAEVEAFIYDPDSIKYNNKIVFDIEELLARRHRTIWFVKPFSEYSHTGNRIQVEAESANGLISVVPQIRESNYIIQISDLHSSNDFFGFPSKSGGGKESLIDLLNREIQSHDISPAAIIISGDLTWRGSISEFNDAKEFVKNLISISGISRDHLILIPGNHDIQWSAQSGDYNKDSPVENLSVDAEKNYRKFIFEVFDVPADEYLTMGRRLILGDYTVVDILGVNSSRLEQADFSGYGFVGREQIERGFEKMNWNTKKREDYRILAMHHHVIPVLPSEEILKKDRRYSLSLDGADVVNYSAEHDVDLIIHGHMHQPFCSALHSIKADGNNFRNKIITVIGAGSIGVNRSHTGPIGKNTFNVLEFDKTSLTLTVKANDDQQRVFSKYWQVRFQKKENGMDACAVGGA